MASRVITDDDLCLRWHIDRETLFHMARRRLLVALEADGRLYVSREQVEYIEDHGGTDLRREHIVEGEG